MQCYKIIGTDAKGNVKTAPHPEFFPYNSNKVKELEDELAKLKRTLNS